MHGLKAILIGMDGLLTQVRQQRHGVDVLLGREARFPRHHHLFQVVPRAGCQRLGDKVFPACKVRQIYPAGDGGQGGRGSIAPLHFVEHRPKGFQLPGVRGRIAKLQVDREIGAFPAAVHLEPGNDETVLRETLPPVAENGTVVEAESAVVALARPAVGH